VNNLRWQQRHWPHLSMDPTIAEEDLSWREDIRESIKDLGQRISEFLQFLVNRPETNIVVVTHGVWMEVCLNLHCSEALENGKRRVHNCDMYALDCTSQNGTFRRLDNSHNV
jgi:broad specificity phosphatase PhoE